MVLGASSALSRDPQRQTSVPLIPPFCRNKSIEYLTADIYGLTPTNSMQQFVVDVCSKDVCAKMRTGHQQTAYNANNPHSTTHERHSILMEPRVKCGFCSSHSGIKCRSWCRLNPNPNHNWKPNPYLPITESADVQTCSLPFNGGHSDA